VDWLRENKTGAAALETEDQMRELLERYRFRLNRRAFLAFLLEHDLFRKPVPLFGIML
jgi:hypothetical protein